MVSKNGILAQGAINCTAKATCNGIGSNWVGLVELVEQGANSISLGQFGNLGTSCKDDSGAVRSGNNRKVYDKGVESL